ncbi:MAG: DUF2067 domain-containing protein [Desulfurococcus sp.]|nr:DUF2067 domain-containing protein [Desulfurococcus sp.]
MPLVKRRFRVPCRGERCLELYEALKERIPPLSYLELEVTDNGIIVNAYGYEVDVKKLWRELKSFAGLKRGEVHQGLNSYRVDMIVKASGVTFPLEVLLLVLKAQGYTASIVENTLYTNAGVDHVVNTARRISELNTMVKSVVKGKAARYYVVASAVALGLQLEDVIQRSLELGVMEADDSGLYVLRKEWRRAVEEFVKLSKRGST